MILKVKDKKDGMIKEVKMVNFKTQSLLVKDHIQPNLYDERDFNEVEFYSMNLEKG